MNIDFLDVDSGALAPAAISFSAASIPLALGLRREHTIIKHRLRVVGVDSHHIGRVELLRNKSLLVNGLRLVRFRCFKTAYFSRAGH